jgi:predicted DNA-binding transcriptional regulator YafY
MPENKQLFYSIEVLNEAINKGRKVEFMYNDFGIDMKPHPRIASDGKPRKYIINPYQMVATNGRYYLICNYEKYDGVSNYRIDRISEIEMLDVT